VSPPSEWRLSCRLRSHGDADVRWTCGKGAAGNYEVLENHLDVAVTNGQLLTLGRYCRLHSPRGTVDLTDRSLVGLNHTAYLVLVSAVAHPVRSKRRDSVLRICGTGMGRRG